MPPKKYSKAKPPTLPIILLTDFGPGSIYLGQMKLVIQRIAQGALLLDLAHDIPPQVLPSAALFLKSSRPYLPVPSVICAVVDPGVGSQRRIVAALFQDGLCFIGPDNGLLHALACPCPIIELVEANKEEFFLKPLSSVFHGRDIIAPLAASYASGIPLQKLGTSIPLTSLNTSSLIPIPLRTEPGTISGVILTHDRFGNLISNISKKDLHGLVRKVHSRGHTWPFHEYYAQVKPGQRLALFGSMGFLELAIRDGSALAKTKGKGGEVRVFCGHGDRWDPDHPCISQSIHKSVVDKARISGNIRFCSPNGL